jgi:hypothetical protein
VDTYRQADVSLAMYSVLASRKVAPTTWMPEMTELSVVPSTTGGWPPGPTAMLTPPPDVMYTLPPYQNAHRKLEDRMVSADAHVPRFMLYACVLSLIHA